MADGGVLALSLPPDVDRVALETLLPGVDLEALTPDTAVILFQTLLGQALELDDRTRTVEEYQAEVERKDVELDQAYQDREGAVKDLEANVDALQRELKHVKDERDALRTYYSYYHDILHEYI
jgi:nucleoprotein TPR